MTGKPNYELLVEFPEDEPAVYDEGLGSEVLPEQPHGKRRVVGWLAYDKYTRERAVKEFARRGIKHELVFPTARFWCAVVFE